MEMEFNLQGGRFLVLLRDHWQPVAAKKLEGKTLVTTCTTVR